MLRISTNDGIVDIGSGQKGIEIVHRYGSLSLAFEQARRMASWILENIPEDSIESLAKDLARDANLDRITIEKAFFGKMYSGYDNASVCQFASTFNLYNCLGMITRDSKYTEDGQKEYFRRLVDSFPDWLRAKHGHDKGEA